MRVLVMISELSGYGTGMNQSTKGFNHLAPGTVEVSRYDAFTMRRQPK